MIKSLRGLFSPERKVERLENRLQNAVLANDQRKIATNFSKSFVLLLSVGNVERLSNLILSYSAKTEGFATPEGQISAVQLTKAAYLLAENRYYSAALMICETAGYDNKAMEILATQGLADDLMAHTQRDGLISKEYLGTAVTYWEKYQGSIADSPTMVNVLTNISSSAPESFPDNPQAREIVGQYREAANLYVKEGDVEKAASCYEQAQMYTEAGKLYEEIGDNKRASKAAESRGDLEKALELAVESELKFRLLIRVGKFHDARELAIDLDSPEEKFELITEEAKKRMEVKVKGHDFIGAMELADVVGYTPGERENILSLGRHHFAGNIASAASEEDMEKIYRDLLTLEELAGNLEEAGRIAEELLGDLNHASFLYEKANLFDRAIGTSTGHSERLAELHLKGGNLLAAAGLFESVEQFEKAFENYEAVHNFNKAIECYLKTEHPTREVLIRLYKNSGEFEKVVELYMKSGTFPDLEKALSIAQTHRLTSHSRVIKEKIAESISGSEADLDQCLIRAMDEVSGSYSKSIGIDFGTTNSVAAIFNKKSKKAEIILAPDGSTYVPTYFGVDENDHLIFGEAARKRSLTAPDCVVARVKRNLGERRNYFVAGKQYRSEEVVANFLGHLKSNTQAFLQAKSEARFYELIRQKGLKFPAETITSYLDKQKGCSPIEDVVLSVPAYFNDSQKRATRDSAEIAGFRIQRLLHEPSAAALAYAYQKKYTGKIAVIDLGGGTLDISILDIGGGVSDVRSVSGDTKLGGSDIDAILLQHTIKDIKARWGVSINNSTHPAEIARLREACEFLKINLSSVTHFTMELPHILNRPGYTFTLTRKELERLSRPILDRIQSTINKTLKEYDSRIDNFILVGNATRMPAVRELVEKIMPAKQLTGLDPGTVVATGAALHGAFLTGDSEQLLLLDVVPYTLGIAATEGTGDEEVISRLIEKNSTIPIMKSSIYTTRKDNQPNVHVKIYQGESPHPHNNYFLGNFILDRIPPAPAHTPEIEVKFDIGSDCILTVTAVDKKSGNNQSIRIEGAAGLSLDEKEILTHHLAELGKLNLIEEELGQVRLEIDSLKLACDVAFRDAENAIKDFLEQFHEKVEVNPGLYTANPAHIEEIQTMFVEKDLFSHGIPLIHDQFASILNNLRQVESKQLDFSDREINSNLKYRLSTLTHYKQALKSLKQSIDENVQQIVNNWIQILESMEPDTDKMAPLEMANYHLTAGRASKAKEILDSLESSEEGLTIEAFYLLLKCYISLGLKEEYRDTHKRYGNLFGLVYPDFNRLDAYLKAVDDSIFMIQGFSKEGAAVFGSGFCIEPNLIVTNRHVIENMTQAGINIVGKHKNYEIVHIELDPIDDIAILRIGEDLKPFRLVQTNFVEPGEQVLALGFPSPDSNIHSENIYISKGIINSIRRIDASSERVIFVDTKFGSGMSGGPLINDLGEVVAIVTLIKYSVSTDQQGPSFFESQPVALPINLVRKYTKRFN